MSEAGESLEQLPIGELLEQLDEKTPDGGIKPSEAWTYRQEVMGKYGLPESGYRWQNPQQYIDEVSLIAQENGVAIRPRHEFERFFQEHPKVGALSQGENVFHEAMIVTRDKYSDGEWYQLRAKANQLSHEIVHSLQAKRYPRMPIEEQERVAYYYQQVTDDLFRKHSDDPHFIHYYLNVVIEEQVQSSTEIDKSLENKTSKEQSARG